MSTLADIATWITAEKLRRADISAATAQEVKEAYLSICGRIPFDELRVVTAELPFTTGETRYPTADITPNIAGVISIRVTAGTIKRKIRKSDAQRLDSLTLTTPGIPRRYIRFGGYFEFDPPPSSSSYTFRIRYWSFPTIETPSGNTVAKYPPDWYSLHKWESLYRMYMFLEEHDKAQMLVTPIPQVRNASPKRVLQTEAGIIPRLWNDLVRTVDQRDAIDDDFGVRPIVGVYTHAR